MIVELPIVCRHCGSFNHEIKQAASQRHERGGALFVRFERTLCGAAALELATKGDYSKRVAHEGRRAFTAPGVTAGEPK